VSNFVLLDLHLSMTQPSQSVPIPDAAEPSAGQAVVPVWLIILFFVLLYWGMVYFDLHGGWFSDQVYSPYGSQQAVALMQPPLDDTADYLRQGKLLFTANCAVCHMENGAGNPGNGCPPLDGSEWVSAPGPGRLIRIASKGLTGPIEVKGQLYNQGTMLPIGDQLTGDEKTKSHAIGAILSHVRVTFGKNAKIVKPDQVEAVRAKISDRKTSYQVEDLKAVPDTE
jgi:mono/diheme cytochrome c family protein